MQKEELEKLLLDHLLTDEKEEVEQYKQNPPQVIEKLQWQPGEAIIGKLSKEDLLQLLSRYLNNDGVYTKNILHLLIRIEKELQWLLEEKGVDVQAKFREDAKKQAELVEERIRQSKEALKNSVKK